MTWLDRLNSSLNHMFVHTYMYVHTHTHEEKDTPLKVSIFKKKTFIFVRVLLILFSSHLCMNVCTKINLMYVCKHFICVNIYTFIRVCSS